jgi:hypothetical protein
MMVGAVHPNRPISKDFYGNVARELTPKKASWIASHSRLRCRSFSGGGSLGVIRGSIIFFLTLRYDIVFR